MSATLATALTEATLRDLAGPRSFERGRAYVMSGAVDSLILRGDSLTARVTGTETYQVRLSARQDGALGHDCTCPVGRDGECCKHCVATGLVWLAAQSTPTDATASDATPKARRAKSAAAPELVTLDDLRPWLLGQPASALADLLLETAERDARLRETLLRRAALATAKSIDLSAYRKAIDRATRLGRGGFIDYGEATAYADGVDEAITSLRDLLAESPGHAAAVVELLEHALARVEQAQENADDSDGEIGDLSSELQDLHLDACRLAKPDPAALARRLFAWELRTGFDTFFNASATYAEILGPIGLATYRQLAETEWAKLPALTPGSQKTYDGPRFRITAMMESLARASGDIDALVAIKTRDLSHAHDFLVIAQLLHDAKRPDDALDWAERGLKAFPLDTDSRLLVWIAHEYHRRHRHEDALALVWRPFETRPDLENYRLLKTHADLAAAWPAWRQRALDHLRAKLNATPKKTAESTGFFRNIFDSTDHIATELVRIHLWEKDVEAAWHAARDRHLSASLWIELAAARAKEHPADALPLYLREAARLVKLTDKRAYAEAVAHLRAAKTLHERLDRMTAWREHIAALRRQHKAKRNFIAAAADL